MRLSPVLLMLALTGCATRPNTAQLQQRLDAFDHWVPPPRNQAPTELALQQHQLLDSSQPLTWDNLFTAVRRHAPDLLAAKARARAALSSVDGALGWPDPRLSVEFAPRTLDSKEEKYSLKLSQMIAWGAPRSAEAARRQALAAEAVAEVANLERHHLIESRTAFANYWLAHRSLALLDQEEQLLQELASATLAAQSAGAPASEVSMVQAELVRVQRERLSMQDDRDGEAATMIRAMLGAESGSVPPPEEHVPEPIELPNNEDARTLALQRPEIAMAQARVAMAQAELAAASANGLPETELMAGYTTMEAEQDMRFTIGISVALPLPRAQRESERRSASAQLAGAEAELQMERAESLRVLDQTISRLKRHASAMALLKDQELPALRQSVAQARADYAAGSGSVRMIIDAEMRRLAAERALLAEQRDYSIWLGELECCIGTMVTEAQP